MKCRKTKLTLAIATPHQCSELVCSIIEVVLFMDNEALLARSPRRHPPRRRRLTAHLQCALPLTLIRIHFFLSGYTASLPNFVGIVGDA